MIESTHTHRYQISKTISPSIFRAYDIRGIVDEYLTPDVMYTIGLAIGSEAASRNISHLTVARDGRMSGPSLLKALTQGLMDSGRSLIDIGIVPTPVLYYSTYSLQTQSGVMLTGSHNPSDYNGVKTVLGGNTLAESEIQNLYHRIQAGDFVFGKGSIESQSVTEDYINRIATDVHLSRPLKVVIDAGNGVTGAIAPALFRRLGCEVIELFCDIDGNFPNHHPDPSVEKNLVDIQRAVIENNADIGLAFDGDGDRLGVVTNEGKVIWPDRQMMLFAKDVLARVPNHKIVFDVKCSRHLPEVIMAAGGIPLMWKTGHSLLKSKMREENAPVAGEMSGHIFFKERWYGFDDGLYAGARLLEILAKDPRKVNEIFADLPDSVNTPELKLPIPEDQKQAFMTKLIDQSTFPQGKVCTIDGLRVDFADGWGLVRVSNTSPYLTLRFEAMDQPALERIQNLFREQLLAVDRSLQLPF